MRNLRVHWGLIVLAIAALAFLAGCGKKPPVVTETPAPVTETQVAPETPPPAPRPAPTPAVDYASMAPSAYGIEDVFFPYDAFALSEAAMATLEKNAGIMKQHASIDYLLEGHCDERGTVEYNLALGEKRAKAVRDYLVTLGVPAARLKVVSYGEERPFASGHDDAAWAQNRRAHFARP